MNYDFAAIEAKWHKYWEENDTFHTDVWDFSKPKYYVLDMFPYPSGVGLHAGHPEGYTATDIMSRMKRMQGYNVLHPMGYDSFGLPAEQYAISTGNHPEGFTKKNIETFSKQLKELGFDYDWSKMIATSDPSFYKWTQWIFKQLYEAGYAKRIEMPVNWCEELGTVLSNDEVIDGKSERGGYPVVKKNMMQWVIDQPAFAEKLLEGLNEIDWPESTKEIQRNWIGKSTGVEVDFKLVGGGDFSIYTTCIETIYGITFMVLAPDGKVVQDLMDRIENKEEVQAYINETVKKSDMDRTELNKGKTGCRLQGVYAINPVNGKQVPVFIGDFVLAGYGTGAVMAVPSHDQRDFEYAVAHSIPMIQVIEGRDVSECAFEKQDYLGKGCKLMNSEEFTGLTVEEAKEALPRSWKRWALPEERSTTISGSGFLPVSAIGASPYPASIPRTARSILSPMRSCLSSCPSWKTIRAATVRHLWKMPLRGSSTTATAFRAPGRPLPCPAPPVLLGITCATSTPRTTRSSAIRSC